MEVRKKKKMFNWLSGHSHNTVYIFLFIFFNVFDKYFHTHALLLNISKLAKLKFNLECTHGTYMTAPFECVKLIY